MQSPTAEQSILAALDAKYEILEPLTRPGGPTILLARQRQTNVQVALRIIPAPTSADPDAAEHIAQAAGHAAQLDHQNIGRIYGVAAVTPDSVAIATEYTPGRTLREMLRESPQLSPNDAESVLRAVAAALEAAHRCGIVHGAVQPNYIVLDNATRRVRLIGFGESAAGPPRAPDGSLLERDPYAAPEHRYGGLADVRTDLYGLGLVGWEMLAGRLPANTENPGEMLFKQVMGGATVKGRLPSSTPTRLLLALEGALQWDRPLRWSSAAAFLHQLSQEVTTPEAQRRHARIVGVAPSRGPAPKRSAPAGDGSEAFDHMRAAAARKATNAAAPPPTLIAAATMPRAPSTQWSNIRVFILPAVLLGSVAAVALASRSGRRLVQAAPSPPVVASATTGDGEGRSGSAGGDDGRRDNYPAPAPNGPGARTPAGPLLPPSRSRDDEAGALPAATSPASASAPSGRSVQHPPDSEANASPLDSAATASRETQSRDRAAHGAALLSHRSAADVFRAVDEYSAAARLDSSVAAPFTGLALAYAAVLEEGWFDSEGAATAAATRGLAAADRALRLDPRSEPAWVARGTIMEFRNPRSLDEVRSSYGHALALVPNDPEALRLDARAAEYAGDYRTAEAQYRRALAQAPQSAAILCDLAELAYLQHQSADARKLLDAAIAADPRYANAYLLRVRMQLNNAQFRNAWSDAEMAARLGNPLPGEAASVLVYAQTGDSGGARTRAQALLRDVRQKAPVLSVLDSRYLALTFMAIGQRDAAIEVLERAYPRGAALWLALQDPGLQRLQGQPRFDTLVANSQPTASPNR